MGRKLDSDLAHFLRDTISSIGELDTLLLLARTENDWWTVQQVARELRTSEPAALAHLQRLLVSGFLAVTQTGEAAYRYRPASPWLGQQVTRVAELYATHRVAVARAIHAPKDALDSFAESFRLREEPSDDC